MSFYSTTYQQISQQEEKEKSQNNSQGKKQYFLVFFGFLLFCFCFSQLLSHDLQDEQKESEKMLTNMQLSTQQKEQLQRDFNEIAENLIPLTNYHKIQTVHQIKQLPICLLTSSQFPSVTAQSQNYTNYHIQIFDQKIRNYFLFLEFVQSRCAQKELIFIAKGELKSNSLWRLNREFQTKKMWASYFLIHKGYFVGAFYREVLERIKTNDFSTQNKELLEYHRFDTAVIAFFQLARRFMGEFDPSDFFYSMKSDTLMHAFRSNQFLFAFQRINRYQTLYSMSQNYKINEEEMKVKDQNSYELSNQITTQKVEKLLQDLEMKSLPINHSLFSRQKVYMESKYSIEKYREVPICAVIFTYNNALQDRYKKVLNSVLTQQYENYHIVFVDDFSSDETFDATRKYVGELGIPGYRMSMIRNDARKFDYQNIKNAAYNFCKPQQIMVIIYGDGQLVGRQVFKLLSSFYGKKNNWMVFTNAFTNLYTIGNSKLSIQEKKNQLQTKGIDHNSFQSIISFNTSLLLKVDLINRKNNNNHLIEGPFDHEISSRLIEMAGDHFQDIPELCYFYNRPDQNDNSPQEEISNQDQMTNDLQLENKQSQSTEQTENKGSTSFKRMLPQNQGKKNQKPKSIPHVKFLYPKRKDVKKYKKK